MDGMTTQPLDTVTPTGGDDPKKLLDDAQRALMHAQRCLSLALAALEADTPGGAALVAKIVGASRACVNIRDYLDGFTDES